MLTPRLVRLTRSPATTCTTTTTNQSSLYVNPSMIHPGRAGAARASIGQQSHRHRNRHPMCIRHRVIYYYYYWFLKHTTNRKKEKRWWSKNSNRKKNELKWNEIREKKVKGRRRGEKIKGHFQQQKVYKVQLLVLVIKRMSVPRCALRAIIFSCPARY